jgi:hypothetical protein
MRLIAIAVAGLVTLGAGAASAQPLWGPDYGRFYGPERAPLWQRDRTWMAPIRPQQVADIVESMGLDPVGPPTQSGRLIVQRAADDVGRMMRVTIDITSGRVVSVAPAGAPPSVNGGPYTAYRPYGPGPYGRPAPEDDDVEFAPPGSVMPPRAAPLPPYPANPYPATPPQSDARPNSKSATATPTHPPQPRKRPENAQAKKSEPGSVAPLPATPAQGATPATPGNAMPPPAPLE